LAATAAARRPATALAAARGPFATATRRPSTTLAAARRTFAALTAARRTSAAARSSAGALLALVVLGERQLRRHQGEEGSKEQASVHQRLSRKAHRALTPL
jgi:hypothetical protein